MPGPKPKTPPTPETTPLTRPLTKSRFKMALECPTKLYYTGKEDYGNTNVDDPFLRALAKGGFQTGKLAQIEHGPGYEFEEIDYEEALTKTQSYLSMPQVTVFEAAIRYRNHFIRADIVKREKDTVELIEVKAKSWPPRNGLLTKSGAFGKSSGYIPYLYDIAYQTWVLQKAYPDLKVVPYLGLMDKEAKTSLDGLNQKFKIVKQGKSCFVSVPKNLTKVDLGSSIMVKVPVREFVELIFRSEDSEELISKRGGRRFEEWIEWLSQQYFTDEKIPPKLSEECKSCEYFIRKEDYPGKKSGFDECWKEAGKDAPNKPRSFELWGGAGEPITQKKIFFLQDLIEEDIKPKTKPAPYEETNTLGGWTRHERRMLQIENERSPKVGPRFHPDLKSALNVPAPWHFIDFETAMTPIPFSKGKRPYELIAFQFSHHVMREDGSIEHRTQFLETTPGKDPNFEFVRALKKALSSDNGTVFRYATHENTVLNQIHKQLIDSTESDKEELIRWIRSLAEPTETNAKAFPDWKPTREFVDLLKYVHWFFWEPSMGGSNSIKVVLPAILNASAFLKEKYSKPIYGKKNHIASLNYDERTWVKLDQSGLVIDPYSTLGPIFPDSNETRATLDDCFGDGEDNDVRDGGAAMMAYCRLQFSDLATEQRKHIENALLRYCELDTLAMAMLWEGWREGG